MPCPMEPHSLSLIPNSSQLFLRASICFAETLSLMGMPNSDVGTLHPPPGEPEALESLRARHLVNQVQIHVQEIGLTLGAPHHVILPDLLYQRLRPIHQRPSRSPSSRVLVYHCRPRTCDPCVHTRSPRNQPPQAGQADPGRSPMQHARTASRPSRRLPCRDIQSDVIEGWPAVNRSHLLRHRRCEGAPLLFRQPLHVSAEHDRAEEACKLAYRTERRYLVVQPRLDLLESGGFETTGRSLGISIVFIVLPVHEIVPEAPFFHRLYRRLRCAGDIALAPALGFEAPTRLQGPRQVLEEAVVVRYPMERCGGEDQIHRLLDLERQQVLALHPNPRLPGEPPPRRLDHLL